MSLTLGQIIIWLHFGTQECKNIGMIMIEGIEYERNGMD